MYIILCTQNFEMHPIAIMHSTEKPTNYFQRNMNIYVSEYINLLIADNFPFQLLLCKCN